jgi:excisionase family DNA binding protein
MDRAATYQDFLTVSEVAARLRVKSSWVYQHADDLGAYRLGKYLRFSWDRVLERLEHLSDDSQHVGSAT